MKNLLAYISKLAILLFFIVLGGVMEHTEEPADRREVTVENPVQHLNAQLQDLYSASSMSFVFEDDHNQDEKRKLTGNAIVSSLHVATKGKFLVVYVEQAFLAEQFPLFYSDASPPGVA